MVGFKEYSERFDLIFSLIDCICVLRYRNKYGKPATDKEERAMLFLGRFAQRYIDSIKSAEADK